MYLFNRIMLVCGCLAALSSLSVASSGSGQTTGDSECIGLVCDPVCPGGAGAGFKYLPVDCDCDKDKKADKCKPSGDCHKYYANGKRVSPVTSVACVCDEIRNCALPVEQVPLFQGGTWE